MADTNVDTYERALRAFEREGYEALLPYFDEAIEVYDPDLPGGGAHHGHAGARTVLGQLLEGVDEVEIRARQLHPVGDRVVGLFHTYLRGRGGVELEILDAHTWTFRDGRVVHWRLYLDQSEALSDAGLDPALRR
jgi:ketosteroid isomerase-like protein